MALSAETSSVSKLSAIIQSLSRQTGDGLAARFAKHLFNEVDTAEFETYGTSDLVALAAGAFESFRQRQPGRPKIVLRERFAGETELLAVDIVNDDMPFLLDSVLGALRELGLVPELVAHPIFEVRRNREGLLTALQPAAPSHNGIPRESFIHLQIRKLGPQPPSEDVAKALAECAERCENGRLRLSRDDGAARPRYRAVRKRIRRPRRRRPIPSRLRFFAGCPSTTSFSSESVNMATRATRNMASSFLSRSLRWACFGMMKSLCFGKALTNIGLTPQGRAFFLNSPPVIVVKANSRSTVLRRVHMETIGIKCHDAGGNITGGVLVTGLFTATAYNLSTRNIPLLRQKVSKVLRSSGYSPDSHSGRALLNVLETFPAR